MCAVAGMVRWTASGLQRGGGGVSEKLKTKKETANKHIYEIYVDCLKNFSRYANHIRTEVKEMRSINSVVKS